LPVLVEQIRRQALDLESALHIAELPHVVLVTVRAGPAEERIGDRLHDPLTTDHSFSGLRQLTCSGVGLQHRGGGLLDLQDQRAFGGVHEQFDEAPRAHAAHADHAQHAVDRLEALQERADVGTHGGAVDLGYRGDVVGPLLWPDHQGWLLDQSELAVLADGGQLLQSRLGGAALGLAGGPGDLLTGRTHIHLLTARQQLTGLDEGVEVLQCAAGGEPPHGCAVSAGAADGHGSGHLIAEARRTRSHHQRSHQPLDIPLPGRRKRLVEIVQIEDEFAFG